MYEIERKFIVKKDKLPKLTNGIDIIQGYIIDSNDGVVRVRKYGDIYFLTIKLNNVGISRIEIEKEISKEEFDLLISKSKKSLEKTRYNIDNWEIDVFKNTENIKIKNLIIAEIELEKEDIILELPDWIDKEVSYDYRYYNNNLIGE